MTTKKTEAFSLDIFDTVKASNEGSVLHFCKPNSDELAFNGDTPLTLHLQGTESDAYNEFVNKRNRADVNEDKASRNDPKRGDKRDIELICAVATAWTGFPNSDGTGMQKFSKEALKEILTNYADFLYQTRIFLADRGNFIKS